VTNAAMSFHSNKSDNVTQKIGNAPKLKKLTQRCR